MTAPTFGTAPLRAMAATGAVCVVALLISLIWLAHGIDSRERRREHVMVQKQLTDLTSDMVEEVSADLNWDAALLNLDTRFDPAWAQQALTTSFGNDLTSRLMTVFDSDDRMIFSRERGAVVAAAKDAAAAVAARGLVRRIRALALGRAVPTGGGSGKTVDPIAGAAVVLLQGRPMLVVASLVGSDTGTVVLRHPHAPVVLYWSDLRTTVVPEIAHRLLLGAPDAYAGPPAGDRPSLGLADADGRVVASIAWTAERPGRRLLVGGAPALAALVAALAAAILLFYRQGALGARVLAASEARAQHLAFHDGLTNLPNRLLLGDRIAQALARARRQGGSVATLLLDLDRFKLVNDTYGHQCGDALIQQVGMRLAACCRASETCARLGGDEFVILAPETTAAEAAGLAERLMESLTGPFVVDGMGLYTGVSIGISVSRDGAGSATELLRQADLALYKAKDQARGQYRFFEIEMDHALHDRRELEAAFRAALESGGLAVAFQPQFDRERMTGVEVLTRWTHATRGPIAPSLFVPLAEEFGLIEALGHSVLRQAFAASLRWPELLVAVNISPLQLRLPSFLRDLDALVRQTGVDPRRIEMEITESVLVANDGQAHHTLARLRDMGFTLALDDFGTGYSSLSYLGRFPIDRIKIDRSFVAGMPRDQAGVSIVRAIIFMAGALKLRVIAEGVETEEQKAALDALGCTATQGYLMGAPGGAAAIEALRQAKARPRALPLDPAGEFVPRPPL